MAKKTAPEYYCVCVRRNYEENWRAVSKHPTRTEAEEEAEDGDESSLNAAEPRGGDDGEAGGNDDDAHQLPTVRRFAQDEC